ncbi:MAG TPA: endo-1,4-beta-xylanase, partial [Tepidisphaeraceae bacterium]|nr:endo-1,4-beta-xylanase [Tepidisphaeraceae bacterium]
ASKTGDEALELALQLSEEISLFHGELLLNRRKTAGQFGKLIFGCRVDSTVQSQKYKDMVPGQFDYACVPMPWRQIQPEETVFNNDPVDQWIEEMSRKRVPVIAGPLVRLDESDVPDWLFIWEHDYDTLRQMAYEYVQKLVARYRKGVAIWNVVAGLSANRIFPLSFEQLIELTRLLVVQVKNMLPQARTLVTVTQPFGEYHAEHTTTVPPFLYAEMVSQAGIHFEGFGLELEIGVPTPGSFTRDLFQFSCMLDRFATLGKSVFITSISAPGRNTADAGDISEGKFDPAAAGRWHKPWDPEVQADWLEQIYKVILSKPYVENIAWADLADLNQTVPAGGLLDDMFRPKPAMTRLSDMRNRLMTALGRKN